MQLSERSAIVSAIAEGGFHVYPAGKLNELIKKYLGSDTLQGDFDPVKTIEKVRLAYSKYEKKNSILDEDFNLLCKRLKDFNPVYDFEAECDAISKKLPALAKKYFGLHNFKSVNSKIVEYYFEGYNQMYKDADWYAFNVNEVESREMKVPVGVYYKRSWIIPFNTLSSIVHENIHQMHRLVSKKPGEDLYVPWYNEGVADVYCMLMLYKIHGSKNRLIMLKRFIEEVEVLNPRKAAYYYSFRFVSELIRTGGLGFMMALYNMDKEYLFDLNWGIMANGVRNGISPQKLIPHILSGNNKAVFEREFFRLEAEHSKKIKLDDDDLEILRLFSTMQPPSTLTAEEYSAALWFNKQIAEKSNEHWVEMEQERLVPVKDVTVDKRKNTRGFKEKVVILEGILPNDLAGGTSELCKKYFVVKREVGGKICYSPWAGGLPFRMGCGEIRCALEL